MQNDLMWRNQSSAIYFMHLKFPSPASMMEGLPFFCVWGWEFSLSLEKKFEGATRVILWLNLSPLVSLDIFKMAGLTPASEKVRSFTVLWSGAYLNCLSTVKELRSWIASFENTRNLETSTFLRWPLICYVVFVCLCFSKNRGSMEPVHRPAPWAQSMVRVHGGGPCFVLSSIRSDPRSRSDRRQSWKYVKKRFFQNVVIRCV